MSRTEAPTGSPTTSLPAGASALSGWRATLERARSARELLDALISPTDAERLVPLLPVEDLHVYLDRIGLEDASELLSLASGEQVRGLLDMEAWVGDRLSMERLSPWLTALMHAGPDVLGRRMLDLDDEVLNWVVRRATRTLIIEDPDAFDPPDVEHVMTPDNRVCVIFSARKDRDLPVKIFLDWLMREDPLLCTDLLIYSTAALDSNLVEEAYRWRMARLADRGYVDPFEALAIYAPPPPGTLPVRGRFAGGPVASRWLSPTRDPNARLGRAFAALSEADAAAVSESLGYTANMALSADRVEPWDLERAAEVTRRVHAGLTLGLHALAGDAADPVKDAEVLANHPLPLVFRMGYSLTLESVRVLRVRPISRYLSTPDDRSGAVDLPTLRPWARGLTDRHPSRPDGTPLSDPAALAEAASIAARIADLARVAGAQRPTRAGIGAWLWTWFARDATGRDGPGLLPAAALVETHNALFADGELRPEAHAAACAWWERVGGTRPDALAALLSAAVEAFGAVRPSDIEPRFAPWYLLSLPEEPAAARRPISAASEIDEVEVAGAAALFGWGPEDDFVASRIGRNATGNDSDDEDEEEDETSETS